MGGSVTDELIARAEDAMVDLKTAEPPIEPSNYDMAGIPDAVYDWVKWHKAEVARLTAQWGENDAAWSIRVGMLTDEVATLRAERDAYVAKLNTRIAALESDAQAARDQVAGAYARGLHAAARVVRSSADLYASKDVNFICQSAALDIEALATAPPAPVVGVKPHGVEREVWQAMAWALRHAKQLPGDIMPAYTDQGNSDAETEARRCAARIRASLIRSE